MDYCSTCRRHLNGALVCPGCGAYAPDIAPLADGTPAQTAATGAAAREAPAHGWNDAGPATEDFSEAPQEHPYDGPDAPSPTPSGRAARRRQRERWKKTQRRALVATAVALVGGGMTVSSLNRSTPDRTQAASTPDRPDREVMGIAEEEATEPTAVSATQTDTQRTERASSAARSVTTNVPHEQAAAAPRPQSTPATQTIRQDSVTAPLTAATASTASQAASTVSGVTDTVTETTPTPTPSATDSSTSETDTSAAAPSPSESSSSSDASSPSGICLLGLVCIS